MKHESGVPVVVVVVPSGVIVVDIILCPHSLVPQVQLGRSYVQLELVLASHHNCPASLMVQATHAGILAQRSAHSCQLATFFEGGSMALLPSQMEDLCLTRQECGVVLGVGDTGT